MSDGDMLIKIIGLVIVLANGVTAWAVLTNRTQKREVTGEMASKKEYVTVPAFDQHTRDVWAEINAIKAGNHIIAVDISAIRALREENGERLAKVEDRLNQMTGAMGELTQALHDANRIRRA